MSRSVQAVKMIYLSCLSIDLLNYLYKTSKKLSVHTKVDTPSETAKLPRLRPQVLHEVLGRKVTASCVMGLIPSKELGVTSGSGTIGHKVTDLCPDAEGYISLPHFLWLYRAKKVGATALPETWDARTDHSHNHLMLGHLQEWFYAQVGGIQRDPTAAAYKRFVVKPAVVGGITFARTSFESPYGTISTDWETTPDGFRMKVEVPANTTAQIWIPAAPDDAVTESGVGAGRAAGVRRLPDADGYQIYEAGSGTYRFSAERR